MVFLGPFVNVCMAFRPFVKVVVDNRVCKNRGYVQQVKVLRMNLADSFAGKSAIFFSQLTKAIRFPHLVGNSKLKSRIRFVLMS